MTTSGLLASSMPCPPWRQLLASVLVFVVMPASSVAQPIALDPARWQKLKYTSIEQNSTRVTDTTITIEVDNSASPLIYPFVHPEKATSLDIVARVSGTISLQPGAVQGEPGHDDFRLWVGVAYAGNNRLGFLERLLAPEWIRHLFRLAPDDAGISRIEFYTTYTDQRLAGTSRVHPAIELCEQQFILNVSDDGSISQRITLATDQPVVALWVNSDGDDTDSRFKVDIERLELNR